MKKEKALSWIVVFFLLLAFIIKYGVYVVAIMAVFLTVRVMSWWE